MAPRYNLPPPEPLEIHGVNATERWKKCKRAWNKYSIMAEVNTNSEQVQVATLLTVIGQEARKVFATFTWESEGIKRRSLQYWISLVCTVSHEGIYPLSDIDSTDELRSRGSLMSNIKHLCEYCRKPVTSRAIAIISQICLHHSQLSSTLG